jgi:polyhydroxyalkanoate synthesis regulator phasin
MDNNSLLRQLLLMGVGTTALVTEQLKKAADDLTKGKMEPNEAGDMLNTLVNQVKAEQSNFEANLQRQIRNILQDLGVPRQSEMDELRGRLDRLERQIRQLENQAYKPR